jgi:hypothetical protein
MYWRTSSCIISFRDVYTPLKVSSMSQKTILLPLFALRLALLSCSRVIQPPSPPQLAPPSTSPFSGYADPSIRQDPLGSTLWLYYSWPNYHVHPAGQILQRADRQPEDDGLATLNPRR